MKATALSVGFIGLVDAAPLVVAQEMGFAAEEGIALDLLKAPSWSSLRDMLVYGRVEAAHMLSPVPVASALGLGGTGAALSAVSVLNVNGNVIGVSNALAERLRAVGHDFAFNDALAAGQALLAAKPADRPLRIGVPFPFSMHAELLYYWLNAVGLPAPQSVLIRTVPPALMADAMAAGELDAFCVGEPWGSITVENAAGELLLPGRAIWAFAPEKVLATRTDWAEREDELLGRLVRATWRAGRWLAAPESKSLTAELLARPEYLDLPAEILDRALSGRMVINARGEVREVAQFVGFHRGCATFPWRSQAEWIALQLAARTGLDRDQALRAGRAAFRSDLHRDALAGTEADLPGASMKIEGAIAQETSIASASGRLSLLPDRFFDGRVFEPSGK
ncbi:ABC transporter substrate-binding protein [Pseudooceanicola sp. CBS1P-1]|uniref:Nitrate transporter n=1 Tax=Pseudooceanicola albus TaxID=2692189 RepID=A0A6L7G7Q4_9RHOB|nr:MULTISPECIES: CmpA/NrtA family ABC transporter substrate-binding protein [Pseudooceanicola]MBT9385823.1 ABC transporter substrate-binding protein [Pseudooceanicola endophyticus]MXN20055.1 nitrate transporter [Pseudooceanicola albus]